MVMVKQSIQMYSRTMCMYASFIVNQNAMFTCPKLVMPSTKQIESKIFDFPVPLRPVMAVNSLSKPSISVRFP